MDSNRTAGGAAAAALPGWNRRRGWSGPAPGRVLTDSARPPASFRRVQLLAAAALAGLGVALLGSAGVLAEHADHGSKRATAHAGLRQASPATTRVLASSIRALVTQSLTVGGVPARSASPDRLEIPRIGVSAHVIALPATADLTIPTPSDPAVAGWYAGGPSPGDAGPAVIVGHLDGDRGPAVFWRLGQLRPGDAIVIRRADSSAVRFLVAAVSRYKRSAFPSDRVYGATGVPELRLITCGGLFNPITRQYSDNLVVFASAI